MHQMYNKKLIFQSTLLVRGATLAKSGLAEVNAISIHAPRERSDRLVRQRLYLVRLFQSTLLVRGATAALGNAVDKIKISIHAPRERSDSGINKKYPQPVFILHKYWIFSDIFQRFWQRKTSFYFFFHCKFYVYLAFAQNIISSQGK